MAALEEDYRNAPISEQEKVMLDYVVQITRDATRISPADHDRLRAVGFDDQGILQITLIASWFNYINRVAKLLADLGHDVHVVTLSHKDEQHFDHEGVMVHRVMLKPVWHAFNRVTRYSLTTTLHWLNFSTQTYRKLKQLHRQHPFHLIQYPSYSFCGLLSIPFLRTAHIVVGVLFLLAAVPLAMAVSLAVARPNSSTSFCTWPDSSPLNHSLPRERLKYTARAPGRHQLSAASLARHGERRRRRGTSRPRR